VQIYAREIGLSLDRPLTVTGGMPFAGGPLNNYVIQATARMAEVLREDPGSVGLVSCLSGILNKQGWGVWSSEPSGAGFQFADVSEETAARTTPRELASEYQGPATILGYTAVYGREGTDRGVAVCELADGRRSVVNTTDTTILDRMVSEELCGREVTVRSDGTFLL
jgi:acetyl-CoA C-acetyltransferase